MYWHSPSRHHENFNVFTISAEISFDGGLSYQAITMTTGNIGGNVEEGGGKCFVWDFGSEAGELYTANAMFRLTADTSTVTDIDGNIYATVQIGDQLWMAENLKVTHYNNGDLISYPSDEDWGSINEGQYGVYDNDPSNADIYGNLFNWAAVDDDRGLCIEGWHVPSDDEYTVLTDYLDGELVAGGKMKSTGTIEDGDGLWWSPNVGATNESGFTALPAGYRNNGDGSYIAMGNIGYFWSSSEASSDSDGAWNRLLGYDISNVVLYNNIGKKNGFSIRCLGD